MCTHKPYVWDLYPSVGWVSRRRKELDLNPTARRITSASGSHGPNCATRGSLAPNELELCFVTCTCITSASGSHGPNWATRGSLAPRMGHTALYDSYMWRVLCMADWATRYTPRVPHRQVPCIPDWATQCDLYMHHKCLRLTWSQLGHSGIPSPQRA